MNNTSFVKPHKYVCTVCGKPFSDTFHHVLSPSGVLNGLLSPADKSHAKRMHELEDGVETKVGRCFCGGTVRTFGHGEDGWSTTCVDCDMMYDED